MTDLEPHDLTPAFTEICFHFLSFSNQNHSRSRVYTRSTVGKTLICCCIAPYTQTFSYSVIGYTHRNWLVGCGRTLENPNETDYRRTETLHRQYPELCHSGVAVRHNTAIRQTDWLVLIFTWFWRMFLFCIIKSIEGFTVWVCWHHYYNHFLPFMGTPRHPLGSCITRQKNVYGFFFSATEWENDSQNFCFSLW